MLELSGRLFEWADLEATGVGVRTTQMKLGFRFQGF